MTVPQAAIDAAVAAIRADGWHDDTNGTIARVARAALEAAEPHIRASERQRLDAIARSHDFNMRLCRDLRDPLQAQAIIGELLREPS